MIHRVRRPRDADGLANSVDPDPTPHLGLHCLPKLPVRKLRIITVNLNLKNTSSESNSVKKKAKKKKAIFTWLGLSVYLSIKISSQNINGAPCHLPFGYIITGYKYAVTPPNSYISRIVSTHEVEETYCFRGQSLFDMILYTITSFQLETLTCSKACKKKHTFVQKFT